MRYVKLFLLENLFILVCRATMFMELRVLRAMKRFTDYLYNKGAILEFNLEKDRRKEVLSQEVDKVIEASMRQAKIIEARRNK